MSLASLLVALVLSVPAAAADGASTDRTGDASLFAELFGHITPYPVLAFWFGGDKGFGTVDHHMPREAVEGHYDEAHPPLFASSADLTEHYASQFGGGFGVLIYNVNTVMWISGGLLFVLMLLMARKAKALAGNAPRGAWYGLGESIILFVRDDMVYEILGKKHGKPLVPAFLSIFFFILFMNIFGLLPIGPLGGTATANLAVTAGLALVAFFYIHWSGIKEHGFFKHLRNFIPHVPWFLVPLMAVVELVGILVKPAALTVRLFANLTAGHMIVLGLFGLAFFFGSWVIAVGPLGMAIAIYGLELFVCFVQAYIFTYLTIVFVGASLHPEH